ncbi:MAG: hypothetical protein K8I30_05145 [Anaerolineae bacterium]|nr:hypothetical protein [Anaerolineae bacterium]
MVDLVERYVHQVGRYLPPKERAEIEAELRSQIQDQLDDRFAGSPTPDEVAAVLKEFGYPYLMATSYMGEQYLVGPTLYPIMMMVLRYGWLIIPGIVIFLNIFGALVSPPQKTFLTLLVETVGAVIQTSLIFSAVVVLIFAVVQRAMVEFKDKESAFNPLELPKVDDPGVVERIESAFGIAIGTIFTLVLLYWLQVGGLTLRFNPNDPGEVIPVSIPWLVTLIIIIIGQVVVHLAVLRRNRWSVGLLLAETLLEVAGLIPLYFAVLLPFFQRLNPELNDLAEVIAVILAVITLLTKGAKLINLWNYTHQDAPPLKAKRNG